jgi:hypothetical protein
VGIAWNRYIEYRNTLLGLEERYRYLNIPVPRSVIFNTDSFREREDAFNLLFTQFSNIIQEYNSIFRLYPG